MGPYSSAQCDRWEPREALAGVDVLPSSGPGLRPTLLRAPRGLKQWEMHSLLENSYSFHTHLWFLCLLIRGRGGLNDNFQRVWPCLELCKPGNANLFGKRVFADVIQFRIAGQITLDLQQALEPMAKEKKTDRDLSPRRTEGRRPREHGDRERRDVVQMSPEVGRGKEGSPPGVP